MCGSRSSVRLRLSCCLSEAIERWTDPSHISILTALLSVDEQGYSAKEEVRYPLAFCLYLFSLTHRLLLSLVERVAAGQHGPSVRSLPPRREVIRDPSPRWDRSCLSAEVEGVKSCLASRFLLRFVNPSLNARFHRHIGLVARSAHPAACLSICLSIRPAQLGRLAVLPLYRKYKLGAQLVKRVEEFAVKTAKEEGKKEAVILCHSQVRRRPH